MIPRRQFPGVFDRSRDMCRKSDCEGARFGFWITMRHLCGTPHEFAQAVGLMSICDAKDARTHRRAVARGPDAASGRRKTEPKFENGAQGCQSNACGNASNQPRNRHARLRANRSGPPPETMSACAVIKACSVSSEYMLLPKKN